MRKAILFGLNYKHCESGHLDGCINDVEDFSGLLRGMGFSASVYRDDRDMRATSRRGIITTMQGAIADMTPGSTLWVHYSGHGTYVRDRDMITRRRKRRRRRPRRKRRRKRRQPEGARRKGRVSRSV